MNPAGPSPLERQALARLKAGDAAGAEADLIAVLAASPAPAARARIWEAIGEARYAQGLALEGARALEEAGSQTQPRLALRRALMLIQAGKFPLALAALNRLPASARQGFDFWSLKADALRQTGRWSEAADAAGRALAANPSSRNMALIRAAGLGHAGQWSEAEPAFRKHADFPPAIEMHAGALVGSGQIEAARTLLTSALGRFPADASLHRALAMIAWMSGEKDTFADGLIAAANARPGDVALGMAASDLLRRAGRFEDALARLEALRRLHPSPHLASASAIVLSALERHDEAAHLARLSAAQLPRTDWVRRNAGSILLSAGAPAEALAHATWGLALDPADQEWIAVDAVARRATGDVSYRTNYDYDRFVQPFDLPPPEGYQTTEDFITDLAARLRELHGFSNHPLEQSLRGGSQLQLNPDVPQDPLVEKLFAAMRAPINQYLAALGHDPGHPFLAKNTGRWRMQGCWSVRLVKGGSHVNHIHPEGWISTAFYVVVPPSVRPESNSNEGWITFGAPFYPVAGIDPERSVCPKPGRLVLFPSYMWHGVNVFSEDAERISVAFDLVPE
ncbi:MAG: tetratricopeptide repeat protein [Alphaproteobacteria bacterium]|nr:tetratricopeptide repeat protein [Alphaproteobacteria bacterium]